jgi:hypothetical protein
MDLKEFVQDVLVQIVEGVSTAQRKLGTSTAKINPPLAQKAEQAPGGQWHSTIDKENLHAANLIATHYADGYADIIEFDVAITVESSGKEDSESEKSGDGGVKLHVLSAGISVQSKQSSSSESTQSNVSRIKFRVPVQLPRSL